MEDLRDERQRGGGWRAENAFRFRVRNYLYLFFLSADLVEPVRFSSV
jgi:hypothetical protein